MLYRRLALLLLISGLIFFLKCTEPVREMMVFTGEVTDSTVNSAKVKGLIVDRGHGILQHGHCYSTTQYVDTSDLRTELGEPSGNINFISFLEGLEGGTKYYYRAYIYGGKGIVYGDEKNFSTIEPLPPVVSTMEISELTKNSVRSGGNVSNDGGAPVTTRGLCWSTEANPTVDDDSTKNGFGTGSYSSVITGLSPNTKYHVRAYAINKAGRAYGEDKSFTTLSGDVPPYVTTAPVTLITSTSAISGGTINNNGGAPVTSKGVCWSTSPEPTIYNSKTTDGAGSLSFVSELKNLNPSTTYYVRAYATNSIGTGYGNEISFTTL